MLRPEFTRPTAATPATAATVASASPLSAASGSGFAALFGDVQAEVTNFIQNGSRDAAPMPARAADAMPALSAEGRSLQASLSATAGASSETQQAFLAAIAPLAADAGERLGVAPEIVAAHAALESGWGQRPLRQTDGSDTHNLFGIKAGTGWQGEVAAATTTEHVAGADVKTVAPFRSYADPASGFRDYAQLLLDNPRYRAALNTGNDARAFAQGLARGGYATDPAYADKLARVASRIQSGR